MGRRRKSSKPVAPKKKPKLPKTFQCPFCNSMDSCEVTIERGTETGTIRCCVCDKNHSCKITSLSEPVDVYCDWLDACEEAAEGGDI